MAPAPRRRARSGALRLEPCSATIRLLTLLSALCSDQYCPNDVISTIDQLREAVYSDILTAIRITFKCMGASKDQLEAPQGIMMRPGVCICQLVKILAPEWRKQAAKDPNANKELLCTDGDPFETIMSRVFEALGDSMQKAAEEVGDAIIDGYEAVLTGIFNFFGGQGEVQLTPPEPCITNLRNVIDPGNRNKHCGKSIAAAYETAIKFQCERAQPKWKRCYYERVRDICLNNDFIQQYYGLFDKGFESVGALEAAFSDAFGDAFADEDPTLGSIVSAAARSIQAPRDLDGRKNICSGETLLNSLPLDQLIIRCTRAHSSPRTFPTHPPHHFPILSCLFAFFDEQCDVDNDFEFELRTLTWEIPRVRCVPFPSTPPATLHVSPSSRAQV